MKRRVDLYQFAAAQCMRRRGHYFAPLRVKLKAGAKYGAAQQTRKFGPVDLFASSAYYSVFIIRPSAHMSGLRVVRSRRLQLRYASWVNGLINNTPLSCKVQYAEQFY
jgi:hypothetical protein